VKNILSIAVLSVFIGSAPVFAVVSDAEFAQLKVELAAMAKRISALEADNRVLREHSEPAVTQVEITKSAVSSPQAAAKKSSWMETIKLRGDFRYRMENIDVEDRSSRSRNRLRARAELIARLPRNVDIGIGVVTGGDSPVSGNQTLGGGESTKDLRLDLAYAKWHTSSNSYVQVGKFKNPLYKPQKSGLLWDGDWRPEGFAAGWAKDGIFVTFLGHWLESDTRKSNDAFAWGLQGGVKFDLGGAKLTTAIAYYDMPTAGNKAYFDDDFFGNSVRDGVYLYDYQLFELGGDLAIQLADVPLSIFANYVENQDADKFDTGWQVGTKLGKANAGKWELGYRYQDSEADAVLGLLSDSNIAGGGAGVKGHILSGAYGVSNQWKVGVTWLFNNKSGEDLDPQGSGVEYDRIIFDTAFKF